MIDKQAPGTKLKGKNQADQRRQASESGEFKDPPVLRLIGLFYLAGHGFNAPLLPSHGIFLRCHICAITATMLYIFCFCRQHKYQNITVQSGVVNIYESFPPGLCLASVSAIYVSWILIRSQQRRRLPVRGYSYSDLLWPHGWVRRCKPPPLGVRFKGNANPAINHRTGRIDRPATPSSFKVAGLNADGGSASISFAAQVQSLRRYCCIRWIIQAIAQSARALLISNNRTVIALLPVSRIHQGAR